MGEICGMIMITANKILKIKAKVKKIYVFFNNCHHGQAAKNALDFMKMLNL